MSKMMEGKVAVVTGAGGGIGRDIALAMAREGAKVVVNDLGASMTGEGASAGPAQQVVDEIRAFGGEAVANTDSVADAAAAQRIVTTALDAFGRLDAVVNNAGILRDRFFHKMSVDEFDAVIKVHLYGSYFVSRAAANHFKEQNSGCFVHMTSTSGLIGNFGQANYAAAKLGIMALSKSIALDMQKFNVRSNCIAPFAWSRMIGSIPTETDAEKARVERMKQMTPAKIAPLAVALASDAGADVTGQVFAVRNNEIFLMSQPRPVRSVHRGEGWTPETVAQHALPALKGSFYALDRLDVFTWDRSEWLTVLRERRRLERSAPAAGVQAEHQAALDEGRFLIQRCAACAKHVYFPRELCPHCGAERSRVGRAARHRHRACGDDGAAQGRRRRRHQRVADRPRRRRAADEPRRRRAAADVKIGQRVRARVA